MPATPPSVLDLFISLITSEKFIAALLGIIGGTIATFIAPWTKWHFKEKELKRESRKEKIRLWREELNKYNSLSDFYKPPLYNELVEHIQKKKEQRFLMMVVSRSILTAVALFPVKHRRQRIEYLNVFIKSSPTKKRNGT